MEGPSPAGFSAFPGCLTGAPRLASQVRADSRAKALMGIGTDQDQCCLHGWASGVCCSGSSEGPLAPGQGSTVKKIKNPFQSWRPPSRRESPRACVTLRGFVRQGAPSPTCPERLCRIRGLNGEMDCQVHSPALWFLELRKSKLREVTASPSSHS